jgi:hypothetical protein
MKSLEEKMRTGQLEIENIKLRIESMKHSTQVKNFLKNFQNLFFNFFIFVTFSLYKQAWALVLAKPLPSYADLTIYSTKAH